MSRCAVLCCALQSLSTFLAEINHHEGLYNKLLEVQAAYACTAAAAGLLRGADSSNQQQQPHRAAALSQVGAGWLADIQNSATTVGLCFIPCYILAPWNTPMTTPAQPPQAYRPTAKITTAKNHHSQNQHSQNPKSLPYLPC